MSGKKKEPTVDELAEVRRVKEETKDELLNRPGVTGVGVGYKYVKGQRTEQIAIQVFVDNKRAVPRGERIPTKIDQVPTDVIEREIVLHTLRVPVADLELQADTGRYDPLKGGISIGPCRAIGGFVYTGTLGAIVRDNATGNTMMLSNFHVMCVDSGWSVGDTMAQPSRVDTGACPGDIVGTLERAQLTSAVDAAVATHSARTTECSIVDIGDVAGTGTATLGMAVRKRGRTTGLTYGTVDSVALTVTINYGASLGSVTLNNQIGVLVDTAQSTQFGNKGDSGSVVVDGSRNVVGLHFAGSTDGTFGVANPIAAVLSALNVSMCVAPAKSILKDLKDGRKDKLEKAEIKELKLEKVEKIERKELKREKIEKPERKELKVEKAEKAELEKRPDKPPKELVEDPKFLEEPPFQPPYERPPLDRPPLVRPPQERPFSAGGSVEERIGQLEQAVEELSHFIVDNLRPDLGQGALSHEPDLAGASGLGQQLQQQAGGAKATKDAKDSEKLGEY
jgi:hypothetical protein